MAAKHALCESSRLLRSEDSDEEKEWWRAEPQRARVGSKRRVPDGSRCGSPSKRRRNLGFQVEEAGSGQGGTSWDSLPYDVQENILLRLDFKDICRFKTVSQACEKLTEGEEFRLARGKASEGDFTAINYYARNRVWRCRGYDLEAKSWRALPSFSCLPPPSGHSEPFLSGHGGLMCTDVWTIRRRGQLVVFNPLTGKMGYLPPLLHPRNPVLVHIAVDRARRSFQVVVAGSASASEMAFSRTVEIFDSVTAEWTRAADVPGPDFGLNEPQSGVSLNGVLFFVAFMDNGDSRRGVVALDLKHGTWVRELSCPIPFHLCARILQVVETDGKLFLFSEQERGRAVKHCIDELEIPAAASEHRRGECRWRSVVRVGRRGERERGVVCVGFGKGKLCIFHPHSCHGEVYDVRSGLRTETLQPPPDQLGDRIVSFNPATFTIQPQFDSDPQSHNPSVLPSLLTNTDTLSHRCWWRSRAP